MRTVRLGNTGVEVSALCLGAMNYGTKLDQEGSFRLLDRYFEAGGRFIDTANNYSYWWAEDDRGGESETVLGRWMKARKNRGELFLATKVGFNTPQVGNSLSARTIRKELEGSLRRLGTEHVDLYYAHKDHRPDPLEQTLEAFEAAHQEGKVRFTGCSNMRAWRIEQARTLSRQRGWIEYCCVQQRHTYLRPVPGASFSPQLAVDEELLDYCREHGEDLLLLAYSPTLGGAYTGRKDREVPAQYLGPDAAARLQALREVASEAGASPVQVVLAWMLHSEPLVVPLVSAGTREQLDEDLGSLEVSLDAGQMRRLNEAGNPPPG
jgi:aryl-alcohol dehydrogenase-like predicted oxidoreductase